jgi:hypothetical protein
MAKIEAWLESREVLFDHLSLRQLLLAMFFHRHAVCRRCTCQRAAHQLSSCRELRDLRSAGGHLWHVGIRAARLNATWLTPLKLTSENSDRAKRLAMQAAIAAERIAKRARILAELGISRAEYALFIAIHYGWTEPPLELQRAAVMEDYSEDGSMVTEDECRSALTACLAKGWLQILDEPTLARIVGELHQGRVLGPIYGLPSVGAVDFTPTGAALFHKMSATNQPANEPPFAYEDMVHNRFSQFFSSEKAALAAI